MSSMCTRKMMPQINVIIDRYPFFVMFFKIFERLVYNKMYSFLMDNKLLNPHNSGFHSGDDTVSQLLSITHKLTEALDGGKDGRIVFLDLSKAFDKVWHKGVLFKLKRKRNFWKFT